MVFRHGNVWKPFRSFEDDDRMKVFHFVLFTVPGSASTDRDSQSQFGPKKKYPRYSFSRVVSQTEYHTFNPQWFKSEFRPAHKCCMPCTGRTHTTELPGAYMGQLVSTSGATPTSTFCLTPACLLLTQPPLLWINIPPAPFLLSHIGKLTRGSLDVVEIRNLRRLSMLPNAPSLPRWVSLSQSPGAFRLFLILNTEQHLCPLLGGQ